MSNRIVGNRIQDVHIIDDRSRKAISIEVDTTLFSKRITGVWNESDRA